MISLLVLAALSASAQTASPRFERVDAGIAKMTASVADLQRCLGMLGALQKELSVKEDALRAEFGGTPPSAFDEFLGIKRGRVARQQNLCIASTQGGTAVFDETMKELLLIEPPSLRGISERRAKVTALRTKYNQLVSRLKR